MFDAAPPPKLWLPPKPAIVRAASLRDLDRLKPASFLPGMFPAGVLAAGVSEVLVDRTTGTNIGNMSSAGGLAAAFDGTTNQNADAAAAANSAAAYVGKEFVSGKRFSRFIIHGSNDNGYRDSSGFSCTHTIRGKNGTPSSGTDGTTIGTATFTNQANESAGREITCTDQATAYTHVIVTVTGGTTDFYRCGEFIMYELL